VILIGSFTYNRLLSKKKFNVVMYLVPAWNQYRHDTENVKPSLIIIISVHELFLLRCILTLIVLVSKLSLCCTYPPKSWNLYLQDPSFLMLDLRKPQKISHHTLRALGAHTHTWIHLYMQNWIQIRSYIAVCDALLFAWCNAHCTWYAIWRHSFL